MFGAWVCGLGSLLGAIGLPAAASGPIDAGRMAQTRKPLGNADLSLSLPGHGMHAHGSTALLGASHQRIEGDVGGAAYPCVHDGSQWMRTTTFTATAGIGGDQALLATVGPLNFRDSVHLYRHDGG